MTVFHLPIFSTKNFKLTFLIFRWAVENETKRNITAGVTETESEENEVGPEIVIAVVTETGTEDVHVIVHDLEIAVGGNIMITEEEMLDDQSAA